VKRGRVVFVHDLIKDYQLMVYDLILCLLFLVERDFKKLNFSLALVCFIKCDLIPNSSDYLKFRVKKGW